ncbi:MAG: hypothetical protein O2780_03780 [Proteobacteria bacterium]|jgi:hypothetical protein|nr:hypothetical protein [Pseudomonadota bacterium]MDA1298994.1 hypothetical protein [Pseudomonadota bacterium]
MYEIPKIEVPVEILLVNEETIDGKMFVTEDLLSAEGKPQLEELLNESDDSFFPFVSPAGAYRLINKNHIILIKCDQDDSDVRARSTIAPRNLVAHFTIKRTVYGMVYPTVAEESRVSDIINQDHDFFVIYQNGQKLIINRDHIVYVNAN